MIFEENSLLLFLNKCGNICIKFICFSGSDVIELEIKVNFLIKPFSYMNRNVRTKMLRMKKNLLKMK